MICATPNLQHLIKKIKLKTEPSGIAASEAASSIKATTTKTITITTTSGGNSSMRNAQRLLTKKMKMASERICRIRDEENTQIEVKPSKNPHVDWKPFVW